MHSTRLAILVIAVTTSLGGIDRVLADSPEILSRELTIDRETQLCLDQLARDENWIAAVSKLPRLGPNAKLAAPLLRKRLAEKHGYVRAIAVGALGVIKDETSLPQMIRLLKEDPDIQVRKSALEAIGRLGFAVAKEALPEMARLLEDDEFSETAIRSIACLGGGVSSDMKQIWEDCNRTALVRQRAVSVMARVSDVEIDKRSAVLGSLLRGLRDSVLGEVAADALGNLEIVSSEEVVKELEMQSRVGTATKRVRVAWALFRIDPKNTAVIASVEHGLRSNGAELLSSEYLAKMSAKGSLRAIECTVQNVNHADAAVRMTIVMSLRQLGVAGLTHIPALEKVAKSGEYDRPELLNAAILEIKDNAIWERKQSISK